MKEPDVFDLLEKIGETTPITWPLCLHPDFSTWRLDREGLRWAVNPNAAKSDEAHNIGYVKGNLSLYS